MRASEIFERLQASIEYQSPPKPLADLITTILIENGMPALQATELAEVRAPNVVKLIQTEHEVSIRSGYVHRIELFGGMNDHVGGSSHELSTDSPQILKIKRSRKNIGKIASAMRALTFSQFEDFGTAILNSLGANISKTTPHSADQGIDFYGSLTVGEVQGNPVGFFRLASDVKLDLVGQAKHYPNRNLQPSTVRELVGSLELARSRHFSKDKFELIDDISLKSFSPVVAFLFTTGDLSSGAKRVAESAGIVAKSGMQLATYLADLNVGLLEGAGGDEFSQEAFIAWVEKSG